jgi:purine-binding chemotaxis protein CheW
MVKNNHTQSIDWQSIRESLTWDEQAQYDLLLSIRAQQYAQPSRIRDAKSDHLTVLTFKLNFERYAIDVMPVRAIRPLSRITPVPSLPPFYRGVVNLRGQIITVLDLQRFFNLGDTPAHELIIIQSNQLEIGLLTVHVEGVASIPIQAIEPIESIRYASGVTPERLIILDIAALFEDERLIIGGQEK